MKLMKKSITIALILLAFLISAMPSFAYVLSGSRQPSPNFLYRWSSDMTSAWKTSFLSAMDEWYYTSTPVTFRHDYYKSINVLDLYYHLDDSVFGQCERNSNDRTHIYDWTISGENTYACQ